MKKTILLLLLFICTSINGLFAQVSKTINVDPGESLSSLLTKEKSIITNLTLTGKINRSDFYTMNNDMPVLAVLDMSAINTDGNIIPSGAFWGKFSLNTVILPSSVTSIEEYAFSQSGLTSITIPSSVTSIDLLAFNDCIKLTNIVVVDSNITYSSLDGILFNKNKTTLIIYPSQKTGDSYIIPASVTLICDFAFYHSIITSVEITSSVTSIGDQAFCDCRKLVSAIIGSSVTSIGENAFYSCSKLASITIPASVTSIGKQAFYGCSKLASITIPASVNSISGTAFSRCAILTGIEVDKSNLNYSSLDGVLFNKNKTTLVEYPYYKTGSYTIPSSVNSIGDYAFLGCTGLTSITIPSSVNSIGESAFSGCNGLTSVIIPSSVISISNNVFSGCCGLTSVTIPSSINSIGNMAFCSCISLSSIMIPSSVDSIGNSAFYDCSGLQSIKINSVVPVELGQNVFGGIDMTKCTLYIPRGSRSDYEAIDQWKDFSNIVCIRMKRFFK